MRRGEVRWGEVGMEKELGGWMDVSECRGESDMGFGGFDGRGF